MRIPTHTLVLCGTLLLFLCAGARSWVSVANAQEISRWRMGLAGGIVSTSLAGAEVSSRDAVTSSNESGFNLRYRLLRDVNARLAVGVGVGYSTRGGQVEFSTVDESASELTTTQTGVLALDYLELPVAAHLAVAQPAGIAIGLSAGAVLGLRTKAEYGFTDVEVNSRTGEVAVSSSSLSVGDNVGSTDLSARFGLEAGKLVGDIVVSLLVEFNLGLSETVSSATDEFTLSAGKNRGLGFILGLTSRL